jgi:raffinose/stachyose/melibiose transport system permease protein
MKTLRSVNNIVFFLFVLMASFIILFPLVYILIVSVSDPLKMGKDIFSFIHHFKIGNYAEAWIRGRVGLYFKNTVLVLLITVTVVIMSASLCAFAIRRYRYRAIKSVYYILITGIFIPIQAIILPLFKILKSLHLINSLWGLSLIYCGVALPLSMMIFTGFYKTIPKELDESATIDGCGPFSIYSRIILPLSGSVIAATVILTGLRVWRDFFIPLVIITSPLKKTLSVGLLAFRNEFNSDWSLMFAAMAMQTIPIVILFLFLQRYFISGVVSGAVKG